MSYQVRAEEARKKRSFLPEEGLYTVFFKDWKYGLSKTSQQPMFTLHLKVVQGPSEEITKKFEGTDKRLTARFYMSNKYSFDDFLVLLQDLGIDLSTVRGYEEDPDYSDFRSIMQVVERKQPEMVVAVKHQKDSTQYYNVYFRQVPNLFGAVQVPSAPAAPVTPPAPQYAPPTVAQYAPPPLPTQPQYTPPPAPPAVPEYAAPSTPPTGVQFQQQFAQPETPALSAPAAQVPPPQFASPPPSRPSTPGRKSWE